MKIFLFTVTSAFFLVFSGTCSAMLSIKDKEEFAKWAAIKNVYSGPVEPIGGYDAGCLSGATKLNIDAPGYAFMRLSRNRYYSHPEMDFYLHALSDRLQSLKMPL